MVGIWCVELGSRENVGRWAQHGCQAMKFDTEEDAMTEARKLRAKHGYFAGGRWMFFTSPIDADIDIYEPPPLAEVDPSTGVERT